MVIEQKIVRRENMLTPICAKCFNIYAVKNSDISCLALIFNLSNQRTTILHEKNQFKVQIYEESYTVFYVESIQFSD